MGPDRPFSERCLIVLVNQVRLRIAFRIEWTLALPCVWKSPCGLECRGHGFVSCISFGDFERFAFWDGPEYASNVWGVEAPPQVWRC